MKREIVQPVVNRGTEHNLNHSSAEWSTFSFSLFTFLWCSTAIVIYTSLLLMSDPIPPVHRSDNCTPATLHSADTEYQAGYRYSNISWDMGNWTWSVLFVYIFCTTIIMLWLDEHYHVTGIIVRCFMTMT